MQVPTVHVWMKSKVNSQYLPQAFTPLFSEQGTETGAYGKLTPLGGQGALGFLGLGLPAPNAGAQCHTQLIYIAKRIWNQILSLAL